MASPFDKVLKTAGAIGEDGKLTAEEKEKYTKKVESILKNGSSVPGLTFPGDPDYQKTIERLRKSKTWNKTYLDGLVGPTVISLNTAGNIPLIGTGIHDPSSTFGYNIKLPDLLDPSKFTPDAILLNTNLTLPEVTAKLGDLAANLPAIPPLPQLPSIPTPDGMIKLLDIDPKNLGLEAPDMPGFDPKFNTRLSGLKVDAATKGLIDLFKGLFEIPIKVFNWLMEKIDEVLKSLTDGSFLKKIFDEIVRLVKKVIEAIGEVLSKAIALAATVLAWIYTTVSAIASSVISAVIGTGSISSSVYNAPVA